MIIQDATSTIENNLPKVGKDPQWNYWSIEINKTIYRVIFEWNPHYGQIVRQWSINGNAVSSMPSKYQKNTFLTCDVSNGLCGVRDFENDSMVWECLLKPMGIDFSYVNTRYLTMSDIKTLLEKGNIQYKELYNTYY